MERGSFNYQQDQESFLTLVPMRQPLEEIKIETFYPVEQTLPQPQKPLTYTLSYDVDAYQNIQVYRYINPLRYQQEKEALDGLTKFNMITLLGERLNASISKRTDVVDELGIMRDRFQNRALIDWYESGRVARLEDGSSAHDQLREAAEVEGQRTIQARLRKIGKMMVSVSPPGGIYKHNFYDIFHRVSDSEIEVIRYMSGLTIPETLRKLQELGIDTPSDDVTDVDLLAHPFEIEEGQMPCKTPDDVHAFLHTHIENSLNREEMEIVKKECMPYINRYLLVVENASFATELLKKSYNAILNHADNVVAQLKNGTYSFVGMDSSVLIAPIAGVLALGSQAVRSVDTGCGFSGGFSVSNGSPFGVLDFASGFRSDERDQYESLYFNCPHCKKENKRPYGGFLTHCRECGFDVSCGVDVNKDKKKREKLRLEALVEQKRLEDMALFERRKKEQPKKNNDGGFLVFLFQPNRDKHSEKIAA